MSESNATIGFTTLDSGPDYLTATVKRDEPRYTAVTGAWFDVLREARTDNGLIEDAGLMGYVGLLSGKVFVGHRWDSSLIRITGSDAHTYWAWWEKASGRPTRLDLQVTLRCGAGWRKVMHAHSLAAEEANQKLPPKRQRKLQHQEDNRHGHTFYIGARSSKTFGRIYHKWAVDPDRYQPGDLRYEVEVHGDEAVLLYESYRTSELNIREYAHGYVLDWFSKRGVLVPTADRAPVDSRFTDVLEANPLTDKLSWLYNQVGPTARLLSEQGHTAEVMRVLFGPQWIEVLLGRLTEEGSDHNGTDG